MLESQPGAGCTVDRVKALNLHPIRLLSIKKIGGIISLRLAESHCHGYSVASDTGHSLTLRICMHLGCVQLVLILAKGMT